MVEDTEGGVGVTETTGEDIRLHARPGDQVEVLEDHADAAADPPQFLLARIGDVLTVPEDAAVGGVDQTVDAPQQGRLARPGETDDCEELTVWYLEADILERNGSIVIYLGEVLRLP
jgi:hypothetical protein